MVGVSLQAICFKGLSSIQSSSFGLQEIGPHSHQGTDGRQSPHLLFRARCRVLEVHEHAIGGCPLFLAPGFDEHRQDWVLDFWMTGKSVGSAK